MLLALDTLHVHFARSPTGSFDLFSAVLSSTQAFPSHEFVRRSFTLVHAANMNARKAGFIYGLENQISDGGGTHLV